MKILVLFKEDLQKNSKSSTPYLHLSTLGTSNKLHLVTKGKKIFPPESIKKLTIEKIYSDFYLIEELKYCIDCFLWLFRLKKEKFQLVLTNRSIISACGLLAKLFTNVKWVVDIWDDPEKETYSLWKKYSLRWFFTKTKTILLKKILKHADLIICSIIPERLSAYYIPEKKMLKIVNCINLDLIKPKGLKRNKNKFRITFVGFVLRDRGIDILFKAVKSLVSKIPNLSLSLIGEPRKDLVRKMVSGFSLGNIVNIHGLISQEQLLELIELSDICVCPFLAGTDIEWTYPIKILEYLAMGKVVIASNLKGIATIINNEENGLLVEPGNDKELGTAILRVYKDKELFRRLEHTARKSVINYDARRKNSIINEKLISLVGSNT